MNKFNRMADNIDERDRLQIESMIRMYEKYESLPHLAQARMSYAPTVEEINRAIVEANNDAKDA